MRKRMNIFQIILLVLAAIVLLIWLGLQIQPASFKSYPQTSGEIKTVPLPTGLPAPVERFYRKIYGDKIPVIESVVISGRTRIRPVGPISFPGRFRFTHIAGQGYRHYIEATFFGLPLMKVNERYVDGVSLFNIPIIGTQNNDPKVNQGANLGMWSESAWFPAIFLTDSRVHWQPVDNETALLVVPFEQQQETYVVRFDPKTDMIRYFEIMRYHGAESQEKTLWINDSTAWTTVNGTPVLKDGAAIWMDDGRPWATFSMEEIVYNVDVSQYIMAEGE